MSYTEITIFQDELVDAARKEQRIELDLDDGIKMNYRKLSPIFEARQAAAGGEEAIEGTQF